MRHWWLYIILYGIVGVFGLSPFHGTDIATLSPVEAVWLEEAGALVRIQTDGGDIGIGRTLRDALQNMKDTAPGTVFLDTADYLIVKSGSEHLIGQMRDVLRASCCVCVCKSMPDLEDAAAFLSAHEPSLKLKSTTAEATKFPLLDQKRGRLILIENEDSNFAADSVASCGNKCTDSESIG